MSSYLTISDLFYKYDQAEALKDINININKNELFGVIGPDGAGKTTLFRLLATLLLPQQGMIKCEGLDIVKDYKRIRTMIGYMPGKFSLYMDLSVEENLEFFASVFKTTVSENYYLIKEIYQQLEPFKNRRAGKLSGGMKQKLALSCALIHKPEILLLDEPTTGVDAVSRREFWDMLSRLKEMGITIVVSTPYMDEAKRCDRVALIKDGIILKTDTPDNIEKQFENNLYSIRNNKSHQLLKYLEAEKDIISSYAFGQDVHIVIDNHAEINGIIKRLNDKGFNDIEYSKTVPAIEDCFIQQMINKTDSDATT